MDIVIIQAPTVALGIRCLRCVCSSGQALGTCMAEGTSLTVDLDAAGWLARKPLHHAIYLETAS